MPPKRRRTRAAAQQDGSNIPMVQQPLSMQEVLKSPGLEAPFELEEFSDWWSAPPSAAAATALNDQAFDSVVDPLLHFPDDDEEQSTLKGICPDLALVPQAVPSIATRRRKSNTFNTAAAARNQDLGVDQKGRAISPRESHILSERQRRKGMNHLFSTLASLLPETSSKSDKSTIVSEIINYIQHLQRDLDDLSKKRSEALTKSTEIQKANSTSLSSLSNGSDSQNGKQLTGLQPSQAPNVILSICGKDVFITMSTPKSKSLFSKVLMIMEQHHLKILDANISTSACMSFHYFHGQAYNQHPPRDILHRELQNLTTTDTMASSPSASL